MREIFVFLCKETLAIGTFSKCSRYTKKIVKVTQSFMSQNDLHTNEHLFFQQKYKTLHKYKISLVGMI